MTQEWALVLNRMVCPFLSQFPSKKFRKKFTQDIFKCCNWYISRVTKEHREKLAKNAKGMFNKFKENVRDIHNKYVRILKKQENVSADLIFSVQNQIHALTESFTEQAEIMTTEKQKELLGKD